MPRAKKRKHEALDDASDFPNATSAVLQEKYSDPTSQDEPAKRPRKRHIHRQSNREKYNTPERREAMKGLHENPTDPRFLPVFQGIQPGYKDGLMVRGRGAVKPKDYAKVVADNFLSKLSTEVNAEPPSYPATPIFGLGPSTESIKHSQASVFTNIPPSINSAREKVNFNIAPQKRTLPNAFEANPNKSLPLRNAKVEQSGGHAHIVCTDLAPYRLILQTPVMKILKPLDAEAKAPPALPLFLPSIELHSIEKARVQTKLNPVARFQLNKASSSFPSTECTQPAVEDSISEASEASKAKRKVVSLQEYRLRQLDDKAATSKPVPVNVLKDAESEGKEDMKSHSTILQHEDSASLNMNLKAKTQYPSSHQISTDKKHQLAFSVFQSKSSTLSLRDSNLDGSFEFRTAKEEKQEECSDDTLQKPLPPAKFSGFKISQPKQAAPKRTVRNPLKSVVNSKSMRIASVIPEGKPKSAKVESSTGPAFKELPRKEPKPKADLQFNDPKTFQPRKFRTTKQAPQDENSTSDENSKATYPIEALFTAMQLTFRVSAASKQEISQPLQSSADHLENESVAPAESQTLALLAKLVQLSNPPKKVRQVPPPPPLKEYKFAAMLPLLPRLLSKRLEEGNFGLPRKGLRVEEMEEESEDDEVGYLEELERSLTME